MTEINGHVEFEQLLRLVDEPAPSRLTRSARRHVASCWMCRSRLEELQETVHVLARYQEKVVLPNLPDPPLPWGDLRAQMRQIDEANQLPGLWRRASAYLVLPRALPVKPLVLGLLVLACVALAFTIATRLEKRPEPMHPPAVPRESSPSRPASRETSAGVPPAPAIPKIPEPDIEVQVFAALHRMEADLGDPIVVSTGSSGQIKVSGSGLSSARQAEIRDALSAIPSVAVDLSETASAPPSRAKPVVIEGSPSPFEARIRRFLGGQNEWENYSYRVLDESDAIVQRAHALRTIEEHFPAGRRTSLRQADREILDQLSSEHRAAFDAHVVSLDFILTPVRDALNAPAPGTVPSPVDILTAAQRMDRAVSVIFGGAATSLAPSQLLVEFSQASADLKAAAGDHK